MDVKTAYRRDSSWPAHIHTDNRRCNSSRCDSHCVPWFSSIFNSKGGDIDGRDKRRRRGTGRVVPPVVGDDVDSSRSRAADELSFLHIRARRSTIFIYRRRRTVLGVYGCFLVILRGLVYFILYSRWDYCEETRYISHLVEYGPPVASNRPIVK